MFLNKANEFKLIVPSWCYYTINPKFFFNLASASYCVLA